MIYIVYGLRRGIFLHGVDKALHLVLLVLKNLSLHCSTKLCPPHSNCNSVSMRLRCGVSVRLCVCV